MREHTRLARARAVLERRLFLKALGMGMAAPLAMRLGSSGVAHAQDARPKRLLVYFMPHGVPPEHYNPVFNTADPTNFSLTQQGVGILGPLEPFKQYVNVLQGFAYPGANTHEGILTVLSNFGSGNTVDSTTPRTTFEHVIARELGVRPLILGAVPHRPCGLDTDGMLFWDGQPVVPEQNPAAAYDSIFSGVGQGGPADDNADTQLRAALTQLNQNQLDSLRSELRSLTTVESRLRIHLDALAALGVGPAVVAQACEAAPNLPAVNTVRGAAAGQPPDPNSSCGGYFLDDANFPTLLQAQLQVATQALICNATPIVGVQPMYTNGDINFAFMGSAGSHHSVLSHTGPQADGSGPNMNVRVPFANAQRWFVEQLVNNVVMPLSQTPDPSDPGRTVLDNTLIYMFSEIGEGAWHTSSSGRLFFGGTDPGPLAYMPIVTIGGGGGSIVGGRVIRVNNAVSPDANNRDAGDRDAGDIYLAIARAMGVAVPSFGGATNPLQELLV